MRNSSFLPSVLMVAAVHSEVRRRQVTGFNPRHSREEGRILENRASRAKVLRCQDALTLHEIVKRCSEGTGPPCSVFGSPGSRDTGIRDVELHDSACGVIPQMFGLLA